MDKKKSKFKTVKNLIILESAQRVSIEEFYLILYELLLENEEVSNEDEYLYWLFVNQRRVRAFIEKIGFHQRF